MKKNNALFLALTAGSAVLIGAIITDNITAQRSSCPASMTTPADPGNEQATEKVRQEFKHMGLPLHEGKYWKETHE